MAAAMLEVCFSRRVAGKKYLQYGRRLLMTSQKVLYMRLGFKASQLNIVYSQMSILVFMYQKGRICRGE
jgi:hypothetical protein